MAPGFKPRASASFTEKYKGGKKEGDAMTDSTKRTLDTDAPGEAKPKKTKQHLSKEERTVKKQAKAARKEAREKAGAGAEAGAEAAEESDEAEDDSTAREGQDGYYQDEPAEEAPAGGKGKDPQLNWGPIITKGFKNHAQTKWTGEEWATWYEETMKPPAKKGKGGGVKGPKGKGKKGKATDDGEGKGGKGLGQGSKGGGKGRRRRKRRTAVGMEPQALQTKDRAFIWLAQMQCKAILQLQSQVRLLSGVMLTTILAPIDIEPFVAVLKEQWEFSAALAENRENQALGDSAVGIGAPYLFYFHSFCQALSVSDGLGNVYQSVIQTWIMEVDQYSEDRQAVQVAHQCSHFSIHKIASSSDRIRLQIAMTSGDLKNAIICGLSNLNKNINISSGPAPPGFFEEELTDWLSVLHIS